MYPRSLGLLGDITEGSLMVWVYYAYLNKHPLKDPSSQREGPWERV